MQNSCTQMTSGEPSACLLAGMRRKLTQEQVQYSDCGPPQQSYHLVRFERKDATLSEVPGRSETDRRSFLGACLAAIGTAVGALCAVPLFRFTLHPLLTNNNEGAWLELGNIDEFKNLDTPLKKLVRIEERDGWRKNLTEKPVYVIRDSQGQIAVLSAVCTHLGCTIPWNQTEQKFICPCHRGTFAADGKLLGGPPPRDMDRLEAKVEGGMLKTRYRSFRQLTHDKEELA